MSFASWTFVLLFLPAVIFAFLMARGERAGTARQALLIGASLIFYAWSGLANLGVLAASLMVNFAAGRMLAGRSFSAAGRKRIMWLAILANVGLLAAFKVAALNSAEPDGFRAAESILIPLALSFVTFQQIGFVVACYRRRLEAFGLLDYLFFAAFFPQLVMGPIVRFRDMLGQLKGGALARAGRADLAVGLSIFAFGLAHKVLLADQIAPAVDRVFEFAQVARVSTAEAWFAVIAFQLQLYFDFVAYSDMAIGLGRMFGIRLPINFDRPLFAIDRFDLWRRWHITFVVFMRAHVFLPLVRHWRWPIPAALAATGFLSGLWHGLGWTFVIWGLVQTAILLIVHARRKRWRPLPGRGPAALIRAIVLTFLVSCLIGAMFRAPTLDGAAHLYGALIGIGAGGETGMLGLRAAIMLPVCVLAAWGLPSSAQLFRLYWNAIDPRPDGKPQPVHPLERRAGFALTPTWAIAVACALILCLTLIGGARRFIYVQF
jgi:D-alanyl-lipoteichoic acid acyltransferase DltB (MBOAT superfamily)